LKPLRFILPAIALLAATSALADRPDSGFYLGIAARTQYMDGMGSWDDIAFAIDSPLSTEGDALGFNWEEKLLLGGTPSLGYYLSESLSLQLAMGLNFGKASSEKYTITNGGVVYQQGYSSEWNQRSTELLMTFHSTSDLAYFIYGGASWVDIDQNITLFEGAEYSDPFGNTIFEGDSTIYTDDISALGFIFGAGFEFPTGGNNRVIYVAAQYEAATTNDTFHGTEDFHVNVGGITAMLGIKWFPFAD